MLRASLTTLATLALLAAAASCTGDDPAAVSATGDGGSDASPVVDAGGEPDGADPHSGHDAGGDAAPASCFGKPFTTVKDVATNALTGVTLAAATVWGPRLVNGTAYFAATPGAAGPQRIFAAPWVAALEGGAPALGAPTELTAIAHPSLPTWSPTVHPSGKVMLMAVGNPPGFAAPQREIYASYFDGNAWSTPAVASALNSGTPGDDEADPWIVGAPSHAVYFARQPLAGTMTIARAVMTLVPASPPTFGAPAPLVVECADSHCGTPVVTGDEAHLVFGRWPTAGPGFMPRVVELSLAKSGAAVVVAPGAAPVEHPELGTAYPSWMSEDGCQLVASRGQGAQLVYATR